MFHPCAPTPPKSLEDTQANWVGTRLEFQNMLNKLRKATEIAVDLEHHSYRSYAGFLCLMQISTREEDFVVDLLVPEVRHEVDSLNEIFTDPEVVKVCVLCCYVYGMFSYAFLLDFPRRRERYRVASARF